MSIKENEDDDWQREDDEEITRIMKLTREDLVREYADALSRNEMFSLVYDLIYAEDCEYTDEVLRDQLIEWNI